MKPLAWEHIRFFKPDGPDNWGDPNLIYPDLVIETDELRARLDTPVLVTSGSGGEHAENSKHYPKNNLDGLCHAIDVVLPKLPLSSTPWALCNVMRFNYTAIGVYTDASYNGVAVPCFHLEKIEGDWPRRFWARHEGRYEALSFTRIIDICNG